jgi:hypothetical protein
MIHCFDVDNAVKYGLDEAIFIENIRLWLNTNQAAKRNFYEGKYWTYNTAEAYAVLFPYWNAMKVHRLTKSLEDQGVLQVGHFNSNSYNRTKWYSFTDQFANLQNQSIKSAKSSSTYINTDTESLFDKKFEEFWAAYPKKVAKKPTREQFFKIKPDDELFKQIMKGLIDYKACDKVKNGFILDPIRWVRDRRWEDEVSSFGKPVSAAERATNIALGRPADQRLLTPEEQAERQKRIAMR